MIPNIPGIMKKNVFPSILTNYPCSHFTDVLLCGSVTEERAALKTIVYTEQFVVIVQKEIVFVPEY